MPLDASRDIRRYWKMILVLISGVLAGFGPIILKFVFEIDDLLATAALLVFNMIMWSLVLYWLDQYARMYEAILELIDRTSTGYMINAPFRDIEVLLDTVSRKSRILSTPMEVSRSRDSGVLLENLTKLLDIAGSTLPIVGAELTLIDRSSGLYHGSVIWGGSFQQDVEAAIELSKSVEEKFGFATGVELNVDRERDCWVLIAPIEVAEVKVAVLRLKLHLDCVLSKALIELVELVVLQVSRAIIEGNFTDQLIRMREHSQRIEKAKTGFLAHLSHEIRGPLGIMMNAVELLLDGLCGDVTADQKETLEMISQNGSHLLELMNDVLDYAKAEAGKIQAYPETIDAIELLTDVAKITRIQGGAKGLNVSADCEEANAPLRCWCDRRHIRQIMINIATNAVKYTPKGGEVKLWVDRSPDGKVRFNVKDTGIGIKSQDRERVFAPFERIEGHYVRAQTGTGIGMSLAKQLVSLNRGDINFFSQEGEGSHFWVEFEESREIDSEVSENIDSDVEPIDGLQGKVLLVSSDESESQLITKYLSRFSFELSLVNSIGSAEKDLKAQAVDIMIVDESVLNSQDCSLSLAISRLRQATSEVRGWVPIVFLSGDAFESDIEEFIKSGADQCVTKPLALNQLTRIIGKTLAISS